MAFSKRMLLALAYHLMQQWPDYCQLLLACCAHPAF